MRKTKKKIKDWCQKLPPLYQKSFWLALGLINLAFLFHTINFMFGDHDWNYVRAANYWSEGSFEGRPLHFVLQSVLFDGHVLPILNNLFSFMALSASGLLLARYWSIPKSVFNYTIFATFVAILPLTLVWLFYAKDMLINLSLPLIAILGLVLSEHKKWSAHLAAIFLFYFALSSYIAVINLLGVCFLGSILTAYIKGEKLKNIIKDKFPAVINMLIALVLFKMTLVLTSVSSDYNTKIITLDILPQKLIETATVMLTQFTTPIPFMEYKYKLLLLTMCVFGLLAAFIAGGAKKSPLIILLVIVVLFCSKLAFFVADERGQILAEMENFAFVPRLDFYGLGYIYALGLALALSYAKQRYYKAVAVFAIALTFISGVRDMYAQKVWKLGFDAEMKAHERIVSRLEQMKDFHPEHTKYRLLQIGTLALRENYYRRAGYEEDSLDLLKTSFTPKYKAGIVYNFYYPQDIFEENNAGLSELSEKGKTYLINEARAWPLQESLFIDGNIIIIILNEDDLYKAKTEIRQFTL